MNYELKDYIADNYGTCKLNPCKCRDPINPRFNGEWVGRLCPDWQQLNQDDFNRLLRALTAK